MKKLFVRLWVVIRSVFRRLFGRKPPAAPKVRKTAPFLEELDVFGRDQDGAQRYFFGYLSMHRIPAKNPEVLRRMNDDSTFWITTRNALLASTFVALGRIFDQDSKSVHNVDKLLGSAINEIGSLSRAGLAQRRVANGSMTVAEAEEYASDRHDLTVQDIRAMRKAVDKWRKVYFARYRDIRHKIFAHRGANSLEAEALMAKTNVDEMKEMLGFLHALHQSLQQLHANGLVPNLTPATFEVPPTPGGSKGAEILYREAGNVLYGLINP
jgi:hypothetical protein